MRTAIAALAVTLLVAPLAGAAVGIKATLKTPAANPEIDVKWPYSIRVTDLAGKPLKAKVTANVIDPFGGVHPMDYGPTGPPNPGPPKPIVNWAFTGTFRDFMRFPAQSRGFKLTLRWIVTAKIAGKAYKKVVRRVVTPGT